MNYFFKELFLIFAHFVFDISIVVIKIIKNMRGNLTNQIKDFLHSIRHTVSLHATECNIANILRVFKGEILQKQPPKVFWEILQNAQENKESLPQVFSCEFCEISKNTFFTEHLRTTASDIRNE